MNDYYSSDSINYKLRPPTSPINIPSYKLLGTRLNAMTKQDIVRAVVQAVDTRAQYVIGHHNLHSLYLWGHEPKMRDFYSSADYIHIDGMSLVLLGRLFGCLFKSEHRTGYVDLLPLLVEEAKRRQWRLFYLGSRPDVEEKASRTLRSLYPGLQIATHNGYFETTQSGVENQSVLAQIRDYAPDVLIVGMSMPRQEIWIQENLNDICANAILCCGALMEHVAGELPTAPHWLGPVGLEWIFRLLSDPVRTWRRYLVEPWVICFRVIKHYWQSGHLSLPVENQHL